MSAKLTAAQEQVLQELAKPKVSALSNRPRHGSLYWYLTSTHEKCTTSVRILSKRGFVQSNAHPLHPRITITDAGREYLAQLPQETKR